MLDIKAVNQFRDGIFDLDARAFGRVAELMIKNLYGLAESKSSAYDLKNNSERIEVKFSRVCNSETASITEDNVISACVNADARHKVLDSTEVDTKHFNCNIQQIKQTNFDSLYYGLFFKDKIEIYKVLSEDVSACKNYCLAKQQGNKGKGQFAITKSTYQYHKKNLVKTISYQDLYKLFEDSRNSNAKYHYCNLWED